ncbi:hypothetical protein LTS18_008096, partial [Coniosporium uncinatum]
MAEFDSDVDSDKESLHLKDQEVQDGQLESEREHPALRFYQKLLSRRVDLVGDYAGNELFMIEGDSLLLRCFSDSKLDFQNGFQMLHAAYIVEAFLEGLVRRKCNLHIVFFDQHQHLCIPPTPEANKNKEKYLLARAAIMRHLQCNLPGTGPEVKTFDSITSEAFDEYRQSTGLYFMMCHDGATLPTRSSVNMEHSDVAQNKIAYRHMIQSFVRKGYNVALVNGLEWMDTKVMTVVLEAGSLARMNEIMDLDDEGVQSANGKNGARPQDYISRATSRLLPYAREHNLTEADVLTMIALGCLDQGVWEGAVKAFLVHRAFLRQSPVTARRCPSDQPTSVVAQQLMQLVSRIITGILQDDQWEDVCDEYDLLPDTVDIIDGRVFNAIAAVLNTDNAERVRSSLGTQLKVYNEGIQLLEDGEPITLDIKSLSESEMNDESDTQEANGAAKKVAQTRVALKHAHPQSGQSINVMPFHNEVFDAHLEPVRLDIDNAEPEET